MSWFVKKPPNKNDVTFSRQPFKPECPTTSPTIGWLRWCYGPWSCFTTSRSLWWSMHLGSQWPLWLGPMLETSEGKRGQLPEASRNPHGAAEKKRTYKISGKSGRGRRVESHLKALRWQKFGTSTTMEREAFALLFAPCVDPVWFSRRGAALFASGGPQTKVKHRVSRKTWKVGPGFPEMWKSSWQSTFQNISNRNEKRPSIKNIHKTCFDF